MKVLFAAALVALCGTLFDAPVLAKTLTVTGTVVDEGCSLKEMAKHADGEHKMAAGMEACAIECAKKGEPLALLTSEGNVYRLAGGLAANKNAKLIPHMNHRVEITGEVSEKDGKVVLVADTLTASK